MHIASDKAYKLGKKCTLRETSYFFPSCPFQHKLQQIPVCCFKVGHLDKIFKLNLFVNNMHNKESVYLSIISAILFLSSLATVAYAITLHEKDYIVTNFGVKNGNPFISVQGMAGGSYDPSVGDEGYQAYIFDTDKGIFEITVAEGSSNKPHYSTDQILAKGIKLDECLIKNRETQGKPLFENNTVSYVDPSLNVTKVNKVYTVQVISDDPDEKCETGQHIRKIYSNQTNTNHNSS
jgi:hypothetical protein